MRLYGFAIIRFRAPSVTRIFSSFLFCHNRAPVIEMDIGYPLEGGILRYICKNTWDEQKVFLTGIRDRLSEINIVKNIDDGQNNLSPSFSSASSYSSSFSFAPLLYNKTRWPVFPSLFLRFPDFFRKGGYAFFVRLKIGDSLYRRLARGQ